MRSYLFFRLYFPCFIIYLLFPSLCAYAQPAVEANAALASLEKYRSSGEAACLKTGLESVERLIRGYDAVDPGTDMLATTAYAADMAYQATGDRKYLDFACSVAARLVKEQGPGPAGSMAAVVFMDLYHITGSEEYKKYALKAARGLPDDSPAARKCRDTAYEFIVVGLHGDSGTEDLIKKSFMFEESCRVVVALDPVSDKARMEELGYEYRGDPILYVCSENACFPPVIPGEGLKKTGEYIRKAKQLEKR
jgi:uncharacterized protein YyaL (SSP411 family)